MNTNLGQQYLSHHIIRRRMRWLIMLVIVLGASLFVIYSNKNEPSLKGFMNSSMVNPIISMEKELLLINGGQNVYSATDRQIRVAVILWDEQQKGNDIACSREMGQKFGSTVCETSIIEKSLLKSTTNIT